MFVKRVLTEIYPINYILQCDNKRKLNASIIIPRLTLV